MSKINKPPMSVARLARHMTKEGRKDKIAVVVGTITEDNRIYSIPKGLTVRMELTCVLFFSGRLIK